MDDKVIPQHIAIIPDGNRRWAKERGLKPMEGHRKGTEQLRDLLEYGKSVGVKYMTLWGFSTENWERTEEEVGFLMKLGALLLKKEAKYFHKNKIRFVHFGRKDRLPQSVMKEIKGLEEETKDYNELQVALAADYGGQDEIIRAVKKLCEDNIKVEDITPDLFESKLDTYGTPPPDLIIRTSGEKRLFGYLPWQSVYAELYFTDVYFPDFGVEELKLALEDFSARSRRYGK